MITLYGIGPNFGLPEVSPYVIKTEVQLRMAGLAYTKQQAMPDTSPKGQLPYIDDGDRRVADSTFIRSHIETTYGIDLDQGSAHASVRRPGRSSGWSKITSTGRPVTRWMLPENFEKGPARFFDAVPDHMREALVDDVRRRVAESMRIAGLARHTPEEIVELGARSLSALSLILADHPYLDGGRPCGLDATVFAALAGLMTPFFDSPLRQRALQFVNLAAYVDRMMTRYYPQHPWQKLA